MVCAPILAGMFLVVGAIDLFRLSVWLWGDKENYSEFNWLLPEAWDEIVDEILH